MKGVRGKHRISKNARDIPKEFDDSGLDALRRRESGLKETP